MKNCHIGLRESEICNSQIRFIIHPKQIVLSENNSNKSQKNMAVLFLSFLSLLFNSSIVKVYGSEEACHQFSVGKCDPEVEVVLDVQHIPCTGVELQQCTAACQSICAVTAR